MEATRIRRVRIPVSGAHPGDPAGGPAILLVTGDADLRAVTARVLEQAGCTVHAAAHSGHALLACLTASRIDVLVTELSLDGASGPALARQLRRHHPGLHALYLAPCGTPACENVLVRPFTRDDLFERIAVMTMPALAR